MKSITKKWVEFAKNDLKDAEILFKAKSYSGCIYHCHQCIEKFFKAGIVEKGKKLKKIHDLPQLLKESGMKYSKDILEFTAELNPYYSPVRYPDIALEFKAKYSRKNTAKLFKLTKDVSKWILYHLNQKE